MKTVLIIIILLGSLALPTSSQNVNFYDKETVGCQSANTICQDADRFLWIGTKHGLKRFDGSRFVTYTHQEQDTASLSDNEVHSLYVDREQRLWVGTASGLQLYQPSQDNFRSVRLEGEKAGGRISHIFQCADGRLLCSVSSMGVFQTDTASMTAHLIIRDPASSYTLLHEDSRRRLWLGTDRESVIRLHTPGSGEKIYSLPSPVGITDILEDRDGRIFAISGDAVFLWNEQNETFSRLPYTGQKKGFTFRSAVPTRSQGILLGTYGQGLMRVRPGAEEVTDISSLYSSQVNMNMVKATTLFEDDAQNLWIGCAYQGIVMLPHQQAPFHFFNLPTTLSDLPGQIYALYADSQNWIWCAIEDNGLYRLDTNGHITLHIQTPNNVSAIYQDSKSSLWVGINGKGLYSLDPKCGTLSPQYPISGAHAVRAITEGPDGQLYVSVLGIGILRYHPHTKKAELISADHSQTAPENLFNNWISAMLCDSSNRLWLGHYGYISCFDIDNNRFMELPFDPKIRYSSCYAIVEGSDHTIWLATRHGLVCYHPDTNAYSVRTVQQGLADNIICGLIQDGKGNLWCSTTQGISFVDGKTKEITNYYSGNGLQDKIYLEGRCTRSADGHIYFGGEKGITGFHPDDIRQTRLETAPFVTDLYLTDRKVNCRTLSGGRQIICETPIHATEFRLSHSDNTFTLYLSMMNYRDAGNVFYEYRLPTLSKIWNRTLPGKSHIQYHHLPPGRYNLELRACENGVYSPVRTIQVRISPPWYASAYAKTGYLLILAGICRLIHIAIQRKRRETIGEMKLQFFINIAHELRSPLTLILNPTESLLEKTDDTNTRRELQTIRYNTSRILRLLDQLLDIRRIDKGQLKLRLTATDMRRLISETADIFTDEARRKAIRLETEFADPLPPVWIDPNNFDKVVVNLLSNALKYTPKGGSVQLSVHTGTDPHTSGPLHDYLEIAVSDTGKGLDEQELTRVFDRFFQGASVPGSAPSGFGIGLNLCQLLVKLHHGSIHAENRTDTCGSRFVVRLPLGSGHLQKEEMAEASAALPSYVLEDPATTDQKQHGRTRTNYRVLIIDDDPSLCGYLRDSLSPYYRIETATDGNEGLRKAVRMEPDLIVSDVLMPNMDGIRLLKELKKNTKTCHIPIILLTTQTESANRIEGLTQGADAYLDKPFHLQELDTLIMNLITNRILLKGKFSGNQTQEKNLSTVSLPDNDQMLMDKIIKAINENLSNPELNVEFLTKEVGISRSHLHRRLKDMTGLSMGDFIRNLRLHQAAVLLRNKKNPIAQITYAVGFTSQSYFSKAFKKFYGMTPTEYRETSEAEQDSIDSSVQESGAGSKERIE